VILRTESTKPSQLVKIQKWTLNWICSIVSPHTFTYIILQSSVAQNWLFSEFKFSFNVNITIVSFHCPLFKIFVDSAPPAGKQPSIVWVKGDPFLTNLENEKNRPWQNGHRIGQRNRRSGFESRQMKVFFIGKTELYCGCVIDLNNLNCLWDLWWKIETFAINTYVFQKAGQIAIYTFYYGFWNTYLGMCLYICIQISQCSYCKNVIWQYIRTRFVFTSYWIFHFFG
jgi:hypothetical protein